MSEEWKDAIKSAFDSCARKLVSACELHNLFMEELSSNVTEQEFIPHNSFFFMNPMDLKPENLSEKAIDEVKRKTGCSDSFLSLAHTCWYVSAHNPPVSTLQYTNLMPKAAKAFISAFQKAKDHTGKAERGGIKPITQDPRIFLPN